MSYFIFDKLFCFFKYNSLQNLQQCIQKYIFLTIKNFSVYFYINYFSNIYQICFEEKSKISQIFKNTYQILHNEFYTTYIAPKKQKYALANTSDLNTCKAHYYHIYDLQNDIIKLQYCIKDTEYILCIDRKAHNNILLIYTKIIQELLKHAHNNNDNKEIICVATLNDTEDITQKMNKYLGYNAHHLKYAEPQIKFLLSPQQQKNFKKINIITNDLFEFEITNINEKLNILEISG